MMGCVRRATSSESFLDRRGEYAHIGRIQYNTARTCICTFAHKHTIIFRRTVPAQHACLTNSRPPQGPLGSLPLASSRRSARLHHRRMPMVTASPKDSPLSPIPNLPLGDIKLEGEQHSEFLPKVNLDTEVGVALVVVVAVLGDRSSAWK